jgi:hypothetical protein
MALVIASGLGQDEVTQVTEVWLPSNICMT